MISRKQLEKWDLPLGECVTERRHGGGYVCGFGGSGNKSSSSVSTPVTNETTTVNADYRMVNDGGSIGLNTSDSVGSTVIVSALDGGAIAGMASVAGDALAAMGITSAGAMGAVSSAANGANTLATSALAAMGITSKAAIDSSVNSQNQFISHAADLISGQVDAQSKDFAQVLGAMLTLNKSASDTVNSNIAMAKDLASSANSAYADASTQAAGNKNIVMVGLVIVGLVAVVLLEKK